MGFDPITGPIVLAILFAVFILWRAGIDLRTALQWLKAHLLSKAADAADQVGAHQAAARARARADRIRDRINNDPRTAAGARLLQRMTEAVAAGRAAGGVLGRAARWMRFAAAEAAAAARNARDRRPVPTSGATGGPRGGRGNGNGGGNGGRGSGGDNQESRGPGPQNRWWRRWFAWPTPSEPASVIWRPSVRTDREPPPPIRQAPLLLPPSPPPPQPPPRQPRPPLPPDRDYRANYHRRPLIHRQRGRNSTYGITIGVLWSPTGPLYAYATREYQPALPASPKALPAPPKALPGARPMLALPAGTGGNTMVVAAESGLGQFIKYGSDAHALAQQLLDSMHGTYNSMTNEQWSGPTTRSLNDAIAKCAGMVADLVNHHKVLVAAQQVGDAYKQNEGAGNRESVTS